MAESSAGGLITAATLKSIATSQSTSTGHQRYYPGGSLAAHTLGFVAYNNDNEQKGRYGLERYYEQTDAQLQSLLKDIEGEDDIKWRKNLLRQIGYKL